MLRLKSILQYSNIIFYTFLIVLIITFIRCNINYKSKYDINENTIEGILIDKKIDGSKLSFIIKGKEKIKCTYYIDSEDELDYYSNLDLGITIRLSGTLNIPQENTIPNTFNYKKYLYYNHINYVMSVDKFEVINYKTNIYYSIKNLLIKHINSYKSSAYLSTLILGDKSLLDENTYHKYQELGVSHIFAISGMHVSILSGILFRLLYKIKDKYKYIIVISFLLFYMFLTNTSPSIVRSVVFFILLYLNKEYDFCLDNQRLYCLCIIIILLINPFFLYNLGFLYSSIISYTLISYSYIITGNKVVKLLKISVLAMLVSLPITINSNYEINILSVINNLIFVPLISVIVYPLSLLTLLIKPLDLIFVFIINIIEFISKYALVCNIIIPKMNIVFIIIYYVIVYIFIRTYNKKYLLLIILLLVVNKYKYFIDSSYYIYYLDVKQGDSSLIINKNDVILIDTGGKVSFKQDEWKKQKEYYYTDNTIKLLKSLGQDNIDSLIITHGDYDHMGEAINLVKNFKVEKVIFNCGPYNNLEKDLIKVLDQKKIKYYSCIKELNIDKNKLYFLQTKEYDNENDNSNVIYTELNRYKFIFMGDAGVEKEKEIINKNNLSNIDVLKVGHHGSNTSSSKEFIDIINPKHSVISVGKNNKYGHPNKEVLNNLDNSIVYRTDEDGSIMFKIRNNKLKIETCNI